MIRNREAQSWDFFERHGVHAELHENRTNEDLLRVATYTQTYT